MSTEARIVTASNGQLVWPSKFRVLRVDVSAATAAQARHCIVTAAQSRTRAVVSAFSVHALMEAASSDELCSLVNQFDMIVPDGQPVRWALNWQHGTRLSSNVRGADLMWQLCEDAAHNGLTIYLYGGTKSTLTALVARLRSAMPALVIAGAESPPFRPLSSQEDAELIARVNSSGAHLMFIGLGAPKQDYFVAAHSGRIHAVQLCVGAAFDFHAGCKREAPRWMQRRGLEWVFRLFQEPRRLWRRYLVTNTFFIGRLAAQAVSTRATGMFGGTPLIMSEKVARGQRASPAGRAAENTSLKGRRP